jgi:hypothetical protein
MAVKSFITLAPGRNSGKSCHYFGSRNKWSDPPGFLATVERVAAESGEEESSVVGQSGPEPSGFKDIKLL